MHLTSPDKNGMWGLIDDSWDVREVADRHMDWAHVLGLWLHEYWWVVLLLIPPSIIWTLLWRPPKWVDDEHDLFW